MGYACTWLDCKRVLLHTGSGNRAFPLFFLENPASQVLWLSRISFSFPTTHPCSNLAIPTSQTVVQARIPSTFPESHTVFWPYPVPGNTFPDWTKKYISNENQGKNIMIGNILGKTRDNDFDVSSNNPRNPKIVGSKGKYIVYNLRKSKTDQ